MTLPVVTIKDIRSWNPSEDPVTDFGLAEDWSGNALDLLDAEGNKRLGDEERLWGILRVEMVSEPLLSEVLVAIVRETPLTDGRTVKDLLTDSRFNDALDARLKWCQGKISDEQLKAARNVAGDAVGAAKRAAARAAVYTSAPWAALAAVYTAAPWAEQWGVALDAAYATQVEIAWTAVGAAPCAALAAQVKIARRVIQEEAK